MKIYQEVSLKDFDFWAGAKETAEVLTEEEFDTIEFILCELYSDGIEDVQLNDLFWFDDEWIAEMIGTTGEELANRCTKK